MEVRFTDREHDVMAVLWETGASTVTEVREHLTDDLAYTTVLTILRTLEEKGYVGHTEDGRAHRYHALVERDAAQRNAVGRLVDRVFSGSPELLLTRLVSDERLSKDSLRRLREHLDEALGDEAEPKTEESSKEDER